MKELSVEGLGMVYELPKGGSVQALNDASFDLEAGRLLTLPGPSGCGKTTLLNTIVGVLTPTSSSATLGGDPIVVPDQERGRICQRLALNALPDIFTGMCLVLSVCWGALVVAEITGATTDLGAMIFATSKFFGMDIVVVSVIIVGVIGVTMDPIMRFSERRLIPW